MQTSGAKEAAEIAHASLAGVLSGFLEKEGICRAGLSGHRTMKGELDEDGST